MSEMSDQDESGTYLKELGAKGRGWGAKSRSLTGCDAEYVYLVL
jgi:hypothetical protein